MSRLKYRGSWVVGMGMFDIDIWRARSWQVIEVNVSMTRIATQTSPLHPQNWAGGTSLRASMMQEGMEVVVDGGETPVQHGAAQNAQFSTRNRNDICKSNSFPLFARRGKWG